MLFHLKNLFSFIFQDRQKPLIRGEKWKGKCKPLSKSAKDNKKTGYCNRDDVLKPVVPLEHYIVQHNPDNDNSTESQLNYVGRDELVKRLVDILLATRNTRGCYLIAGYRGVGKTRFVNRVLNFYNYHFEEYIVKNKKQNNLAYDTRKNQFIKWVPQGAKIVETAKDKEHAIEAPYFDAFGQYKSIYWKIIKRNYYNFVHGGWNKEIVNVNINLGHDTSFTVKEVLSDISQLIEQELKRKFSRFKKFYQWMSISIIVSLTAVLMLFATNWVINKKNNTEIWIANPNIILVNSIEKPNSNHTHCQYLGCYRPEINSTFFYYWSMLIVGSLFVLWIVRRVYFLIFFPVYLINKFKQLNRDISNNSNQELRLGPTKIFGFTSQSYSKPKLDERSIENRLINLIKRTRDHNNKVAFIKESRVLNLFLYRFASIIDIIIVFDELDKITGYGKYVNDNEDSTSYGYKDIVRRRKARVVELLSGLKNLITSAGTRFLFIAGREMLDSYQAERGSTNSLYESLFDDVLEIPSLLTDNSDGDSGRLASLTEVYVVKRLMDPRVASYIWYLKEQKAKLTETIQDQLIQISEDQIRTFLDEPGYELSYQKLVYEPYVLSTYFTYLIHMGVPEITARHVVHNLRNLVHFLTNYSWGNCKRLGSLFESFVKSGNIEVADSSPIMPAAVQRKPWFYIRFDYIDQQRLGLGSNIYIMYHHHLSREMRYSGDKLAVATMSALHFILKFHHWGFSRHHLHLMTETLNIFSSPELNRSIDTVLSLVLRPYLRRIRNGLYRYRFNLGFTQEIRYISRINDLESASFTFSLDAMEEVKEQYRKNLNDIIRNCGSAAEMQRPMAQNTIAEQNITLGDLFALENDFDDAVIHFQQAIDIYECWQNQQDKQVNQNQLPPEKLQRLIESMLKLGDIEERRQRYDRAATIYQQARRKVEEALEYSDTRAFRADEHIDQTFLISGDSKWDTFKQPYWSALFLNLKRSSSTALDLNPNLEKLPDFLYKTDQEARGKFRLGNYFFFINDHARAIPCYLETISASQSLNQSREFSSFLGGYALVNLAENLIVDFIRKTQKALFLINKPHEYPDKNYLVDCYVHMLNHFLEVSSGNKHFSSLESIIDRIFCSEDSGLQLNKTFLNNLELLTPDNELYESCITADTHYPVTISECIALYLYAGQSFFDNALYYHAGYTYTRLLYMWGLLLDLYPWAWMNDTHLADVKAFYESSSKWITECRHKAQDAISSVHSRSHSTFVKTSYQRDFNAWYKPQFSKNDKQLTETKINISPQINGIPEIDTKQLDKLSNTSCQVFKPFSILFDSKETPDEISHSIFWHHSIISQKMVFGGLYEYSVRASVCQHRVFPVDLVRQDLPIYSSDASIMSKWLTGRSLALELDHLCFFGILDCYRHKHKTESKSELIKHLCIGEEFSHFKSTLNFKSNYEDEALYTKTKTLLENYLGHSSDQLNLLEDPQDFRKALYLHAQKAIKNLYLASKDIRIISDNDQALNFPPQSYIFKTIWLILFRLNKFEVWRACLNKYKEKDDKTGFPINWRPGCHYRDISFTVQQQLSKYGKKNIPTRIYDFSYVSNRTKRYLKSAWKMGDVSGRARIDVLRNRYYLSDDYEDPEFHAIWSQIQVTGATAYILYIMISQEIKNYRNDYFDRTESEKSDTTI